MKWNSKTDVIAIILSIISFRIVTNASIIDILTWMAVGLCKTEESIATPCSVNTCGFTVECFNEDKRSQFATSSIFSLSES